MGEPFQTYDDIKAWLTTQPHDVISVFAARASLRVIPSFVTLIDHETLKNPVDTIMLSSLWATALALSAGHWPDRAEVIQVKAAAAAADAVATVAAYAAYAAYAADAADAADAAADAAAAAAAYATDADAYAYAYAEYSWDSDFIDGGNSVQDLCKQRLWNHDELFEQDWEKLKPYLLSLGQNWEVWTDWYDARLRGETLTEEIEIGLDPKNGQVGRITLPREYYKDAAKANAAIKKVIEDYWARQDIPPQDITTETFAITPEGHVTSTTQEIGKNLLNVPSQLDWYEELRDTVASAQSLGVNKLGNLGSSALSRFAEALPENISEARVARIWPRANKIRRIIERHDALAEEDFDPDRLDSEVAGFFRDITGVFNNFRIGDPSLLAADQNAISPREAEETLVNIEPLQPMLIEILEDVDVTEDAASPLEEIANLDTNEVALQNKIMGRLDVEQKEKVLRNFIIAKIKWARDEPHKAAGAVVLTEKFVKYIGQCIQFLKDHPFLQNLLKLLLGGG